MALDDIDDIYKMMKPFDAAKNTPAYNRLLAQLPRTKRRAVVKAMRETRVYSAPACHWPRPSSYRRYSMSAAAK